MISKPGEPGQHVVQAPRGRDFDTPSPNVQSDGADAELTTFGRRACGARHTPAARVGPARAGRLGPSLKEYESRRSASQSSGPLSRSPSSPCTNLCDDDPHRGSGYVQPFGLPPHSWFSEGYDLSNVESGRAYHRVTLGVRKTRGANCVLSKRGASDASLKLVLYWSRER